MSKPSIILMPGSFAPPELYDDVVNGISAKGYDIKAIHPPSIAPISGLGDRKPPSMYDDAAFIADTAEKLANEGKDVILVAHSYGGVPTTQSVEGLSKDERQRQGKEGGVVRIAYMTAVVPAVGVAAAEVLANVPKEQSIDLKTDDNGWMYHDPISATAAIAFSDLSQEEGEAFVKRFAQHSSVSFGDKLTYAGYKDVPVSYLLCEDDLCIPAEDQKLGIALIEKESGRKVDVTSIKAGHCPMSSKPQAVIDWLLEVIEKV